MDMLMSVTCPFQAFINHCFRRIMNIWWPEEISNKELLWLSDQLPINEKKNNKIKGCRWKGYYLMVRKWKESRHRGTSGEQLLKPYSAVGVRKIKLSNKSIQLLKFMAHQAHSKELYSWIFNSWVLLPIMFSHNLIMGLKRSKNT